ncbi:hypothetical protein HDU98_010350 [Podochytrium sp. JEL0797]|nr:hypothetical protein HDU98_010350 [Podochytrium sp. JEL0797]
MKFTSSIALFMLAAAANIQAAPAPAPAPAPQYAYAYDADAAIRPYLPTLCTNYWGIDADDTCLGYVHTFSAQYRITTNVFVGHVLEVSAYTSAYGELNSYVYNSATRYGLNYWDSLAIHGHVARQFGTGCGGYSNYYSVANLGYNYFEGGY